MPVLIGFFLMALIRPLPSLDYFVEAAPAAALFAAIVASKLWRWRLWDRLRASPRISPTTLRLIAVACLGVTMALPFVPWQKKGVAQSPLPTAYCDSAAHWIDLLGPGQTVLDLSGICGLRIFDTGKPLHPPFTYAGNWFRPKTPWVGNAVSGDSSEATAIGRLRKALARGSDAGVVVANGSLLREVEERGWESFFYDEWRLGVVSIRPGTR